jgi:hypothetical protein
LAAAAKRSSGLIVGKKKAWFLCRELRLLPSKRAIGDEPTALMHVFSATPIEPSLIVAL